MTLLPRMFLDEISNFCQSLCVKCPIFLHAAPGFCLKENCRHFTDKEKCGYPDRIKAAERELIAHRVRREGQKSKVKRFVE